MPESAENPLFDATVVYIYSDLPTYSRVKKTLPVLRDLVEDVHFIGCRRPSGWSGEFPEGVTYHIYDREIPYGLGGIPEVARFMFYMRRELLRIQPDVVIVVNEEYVLPFLLRFFPRPESLVLEMYDSISMRIAKGGPVLKPLWRVLSAAALLGSDALIEVHESRLELYPYKPDLVTVLHNAPPAAFSLTPPADLPVKKYLYVGGTIQDELMGIEPLVEALERVPEVEVLAAGKPVGRFVEQVFLTHPRVHYIGVRPYEEVPGIVAGSVGMYAHASPSRLNYRYGAPNKLYEAYQAGVPVLMNTENRVHIQPKELGCGLFSPYGDVEALASNLRSLWNDPDQFSEGCGRAQEMYRVDYAWDQTAPERYTALFRQLGVHEVNG